MEELKDRTFPGVWVLAIAVVVAAVDEFAGLALGLGDGLGVAALLDPFGGSDPDSAWFGAAALFAGASSWERNRPGRDHPVDTACTAPWVSLELDPAGIVYACCANQLYPLGRIGPDRLRDLWDGPRARVLKNALRGWDLSVGCASCRWHLGHGRDLPEAAIYDLYPFDTAEPAGPVSMAFALSNRCNLACAMCSPALSSTIQRRAGLLPLADPYDDLFFEDLDAFLPGLRFAKFLGGEPFLIPGHQRIWDRLVEVGARPRLHVTTNGTVWTDRVERLLDEFVVDLSVSVDGASAATYEAVRDGADFSVVRRNVERFGSACHRSGAELRINFCLMPATAHELFDVLAWADGLGAPVSVIVVTDTGHALYREPLERLEHLDERWEQQDREGSLGLNAARWSAQREQLRQVILERRAGAVPAIGQAVAPPPGFLDGLVAASRNDPGEPVADLAEERDRLRAWAGGGAVAEVEFDGGGVVLDVPAVHGRLGVTPSLRGGTLADLLLRLSLADGRPAWAVEVDGPRPGVTVRSVVLSVAPPSRGGTGTVVRLVGVATDPGAVVLVAEDRFYDGSSATPVVAPTRR